MNLNSLELTSVKKLTLRFSKPLLYAKLLIVILLLSTSGTFAQSTGSINLNYKHKPLSVVFKTIKKQSNYVFITGNINLEDVYITVKVEDATIEQAMAACLKYLSFDYRIIGKTVVISEKANSGPEKSNLGPEESSTAVGGIINDNEGHPLPGAAIAVKGFNKGVVTNNDGSFLIDDFKVGGTLLISYLGFIPKEITVKQKGDLGIITLLRSNSKLDEVQILAYGQATSERYSTGSSVKITSEDIEKQPVTNVLQALEGRVPGLIITQSSGLPGADITVQIRGQNSIDPSASQGNNTNVVKNAPLYIVDGIPFPGSAINQQASSADANGSYNYLTGPNGNGSPLATISPSDIESIEILKDADATAIYGSRGANGVILITTKKGKAGKTSLSLNINSGMNIIPQALQVLDLPEYLNIRKEAFANDNRTPTAANAPDLTLWSQTQATDFRSLLIGKPYESNTGNITISGGTGGTTFSISGNYNKQNSIYNDNRSSDQYGVHFSLGYISSDSRFNASVTAMISNSSSNLANASLYAEAYALPPNFPLYDASGKLYWYTQSIPNIANPLSVLNSTYQNNMSMINSSINLRYKILYGLSIGTNLGYNKTQSNQSSLIPSTAVSPSILSFFQPSATYAESYSENFVLEPQINYNHMFGKGKFDALLGGTIQKTVYEQPFYIQASGFASDLYLSNLSLANSYTVYNGYNAYNYASVFGSANYIYDDRYVLNATIRRDGSSKFGPSNLYGNFGAMGAAWIFTSEKFMGDKPSWLSYGKLRGSYGLVGSDAVENYSFLSTYNGNTSAYYGGENGITPTRLANADFKWETTKKLEAAIDLGFFKDRAILSVAYFRDRTDNQLLSYPLPTQTGFSSYTANLPALVQNTGVEFSLSVTPVKSKDFSWNIAANATMPQNKLLSFPGLANSPYASSYVVGKPISSIYLYHYTGKNAAGEPTFEDVDKDGSLTPLIGANTGLGDYVYAGNGYPTMYGGLANTFKYKQFQLDVFFQFTTGAQEKGIFSYINNPPGYLQNIPTAVVTKINELGLSKIYTTSSYSQYYNELAQSDALLSTISFGRLTNLAFSYNLPANVVKHLGISGLKAYFQAQNLWTFTLSGQKYPGIDPETGPIAVPPLRVLVAGLQFSL